MIRTSMLDSLLHGYSSSEEQLALTMQMLDLRIGPCAIVVILRIEGYSEPATSSLAHLNVASAILRESVLWGC